MVGRFFWARKLPKWRRTHRLRIFRNFERLSQNSIKISFLGASENFQNYFLSFCGFVKNSVREGPQKAKKRNRVTWDI